GWGGGCLLEPIFRLPAEFLVAALFEFPAELSRVGIVPLPLCLLGLFPCRVDLADHRALGGAVREADRPPFAGGLHADRESSGAVPLPVRALQLKPLDDLQGALAGGGDDAVDQGGAVSDGLSLGRKVGIVLED